MVLAVIHPEKSPIALSGEEFQKITKILSWNASMPNTTCLPNIYSDPSRESNKVSSLHPSNNKWLNATKNLALSYRDRYFVK